MSIYYDKGKEDAKLHKQIKVFDPTTGAPPRTTPFRGSPRPSPGSSDYPMSFIQDEWNRSEARDYDEYQRGYNDEWNKIE